MTHEQYEQAAQFWNKKEQIQMPEKSLKQAIEKYILENNTCALAHAEYKKIPLSTLKKLNPPINLICITPVKIEALFSEFKKDGYSSRQTLEFV